jgi:hypothetical protein
MKTKQKTCIWCIKQNQCLLVNPNFRKYLLDFYSRIQSGKLQKPSWHMTFTHVYSLESYRNQVDTWLLLTYTVWKVIKTDCHDITEILLKVALNTITLTCWYYKYDRLNITGFNKQEFISDIHCGFIKKQKQNAHDFYSRIQSEKL